MSATALTGLQQGLPSHRIFPTLDGYRAIAAFMVLTTHVAFSSGLVAQLPWGAIPARFDWGVTVFFLLSGFLLYRPWALAAMTGGRGQAVGRFWWRRAMRIFPAYWVMLTFTLLVLPEIQPVAWSTWAAYVPLLHIYLIPGVGGLSQTWSLATEVSFYAVLPLLAWFVGRRGRGDPDRSARAQLQAMALVAAVSWVYIVARAEGAPGLTSFNAAFWLPGFLDWFAIGMAFAVVSARLSLPGRPRWAASVERLADDVPTCLTAAALVFLIACTPLGGPYTLDVPIPWTVVAKHALYGAAAALFLAPGFLGSPSAGRWRTALASRPMVLLGTISYGVFLWHLVLLDLSRHIFDWPLFGGNFLPMLAVTAVSASVVAWLSWILLEAPLQRLSHRWPRRRPPRAELTPSTATTEPGSTTR